MSRCAVNILPSTEHAIPIRRPPKPRALVLMFKFRKKRSAHGINYVQTYTPSGSHKATTSAKMGIAGDAPAQASDSVITDQADAGAVNEPLVWDFAAMHDGYTKEQSPPLTPPHSHKTRREHQDTWIPDEEQQAGPSRAPAPPDFTRRGIHIPSRTRLDTTKWKANLHD